LAAWLLTQSWHYVAGPSLSDNTRAPALATLALAALATLAGSWALLDLPVPAPWLHRTVLLLTVLIVMGAGYRLGLGRMTAPWGGAGQIVGDVLLMLAVPTLAGVLGQEFFLYDHELRTTPLAWSAVALVAVLLAAVMAVGIWLAVARSNPAGLSEAARVRLVWGAELVFVLLWVHLRVNVPDLVPTFIGRNWAFVLMALGFLGVGLGELCKRRGLNALAGPLGQTGLFLPLLPVLALLVRPVAELGELGEAVPGLRPIFRYIERLPQHFALHALLWFLLSLLYAFAAILRRASGFALLAALAANFGLWVIYHHVEGLAFVLHPQLWLVPLGLIVLVAECLNRERLTPGQAQAVRYLGLLLIYLSSTADLFLAGLGDVGLSLVLAVLAVLGVLAGILLRLRAFLFLGVSFLFLVVFARIWHAAVERAQTWVWWASGIVLGVAILALFALFEKRRNDVLGVVERLRRWD